MKKYLAKEQQSNIENIIAKVEEKTSCEIVPVLARASDKYLHASYFGGFILSLVVYMMVSICYQFQGHGNWNSITYLEYQGIIIGIMICSFVSGAWLTQKVPALMLPFISREEMDLQVRRRARQAYFDYCRGRTEQDTGIILYISLFEHIVLVQGDNAVSKKISQQQWQDISDMMLAQLKQGNIEQAFIDGIKQTGRLTSKFFPLKTMAENQLPNEIRFIG